MYEAEQLRQLQLLEIAIKEGNEANKEAMEQLIGATQDINDSMSGGIESDKENNDAVIEKLDAIIEILKESVEAQNNLVETINKHFSDGGGVYMINNKLDLLQSTINSVDKHQVKAMVWSGVMQKYYEDNDNRSKIESAVNTIVSKCTL